MGKTFNYYEFFTTENKSGWKTRTDRLKNKEPKIYESVINFNNLNRLDHLPFKQQVWHFINEEPIIPTCSHCGSELKFKRSLIEGYGKYCSITCTNKDGEHIDKAKQTWKSKEDVIREKITKTNVQRYGVDNTWKRLDMVEGGFIKNHGVNHVSQVEGVLGKRRTTNLDRYGFINNLCDDDILRKTHGVRRETFLKKYENYEFLNYSGNDLSIRCGDCDSVYEINRTIFRYRDIVKVNPCTICNPISEQTSIQEKELQNFILSLTDDVVFNDRETIKPKELDILLPTYKLGVEFDGLYWHSDHFIPNDYHINKTLGCELSGINLIHIFEDEWVNKKEIVKSIIRNRLGLSVETIYARKTTVCEIGSKQYKEFCNTNHIQGYVNSKIKLGLFRGDELVSVMSFGGLRKSLGSDSKEGSYEMLRFCNKLNTNVVGGASKLFKFFIQTYKPLVVISFSDNRYFDGSLYEKLGFEYDKTTKPNYYYIMGDLVRHNRYKFRKDVLVKDGFDIGKTEKEIMVERGYNRIYDCGNKKWLWCVDSLG